MFQDSAGPYDLYAVALATVLAAGMVLWSPATGLRALVVLPFLLLGPGYAIASALYPRRGDTQGGGSSSQEGLDGLERFALTIGLSLAMLALTGLVANLTPWGIQPWVLLVTITLVTLSAVWIAVARRREVPVEERFRLRFSLRSLPTGSPRGRMLSVGLIIAGLFALTSVGYAVVTDRSDQGFTELYLLDEEGMSESYPTNVSPGENVTVTVVVENQEGHPATYNVSLVSERGAFQEEGDDRTFVPEEEQALEEWEVDLDDGQRHKHNASVTLEDRGHHRVLVSLEMDQVDRSPYREVYLWVTVRG